MKKSGCWVAGIGLGLLPWVLVSALEIGEPVIRNFEPREYRGAMQVWSIVQDRRGVMYFGTWGEILEFDGQSWRRLLIRNESPVRSLAIDREDVIYVGGMGELGFLGCDQQGQLMYQSLVDQIPREQRDFKDVWFTEATPQGVYFISLNKIFRWHQRKMSVLPLLINGFGRGAGQLFVATAQGLCRINQDKAEILPGSEMTAGKRILLVIPDLKSNRLLVLTSDQGCYLFDLDAAQSDPSRPRFHPFLTEADAYLRQNTLYTGIVLGDQGYALGTWKGGVVIIDRQGKLVRIINENRGLLNNSVSALFQDRSANLWVGLQSGIAHVEISSPLSRFSKLSGILSTVTAITRHQGHIFAGLIAHGPIVLPSYQLKIQQDALQFSPIRNFRGRYAWDFLSVGKALLVASEEINVVIDNQASRIKGSPIAYSLCQSRLFPNFIFLGIAEPSDGGLGFLEMMDGAANIVFRGKLPGIQEIIRQVISDRDGNLWLATFRAGIIQVRFKGKDVRNYDVIHYSTAQGLPKITGENIFLFNGQVLVTTSEGLYQAVPSGHEQGTQPPWRFIKENTVTKWFNNPSVKVFEVVKSAPNQFLIRSSLGTGFLTRHPDGSQEWDARLLRGIDEMGKTWLDRDGIIWLGSADSVLRYDPAIKKDFNIPYSVLIRQVKINSIQEVFQGTYYRPQSRRGNLYTVFSTTQPPEMIPTLTYRENSLSFYFSSLFYEQMPANKYQYQLQGFDREWSSWSGETKKEYTNIPEGSYCFRVQAKNIHDQLSSIAEYRFSILPPWQRTLLAYVGFVLGFIIIIFTAVRLNSRRLIAAKERLEKVIAERTAEVVRQKDEIQLQKGELEVAYGELYSTNRQLNDAKNALWGEMALAKKIQTVLLPEQPQIPGYEICAYMKPADEVGGDYYDVINCVRASRFESGESPLHWIVIGDVSGHGVPAGLVMMMVQTAIHTVTKINPDLTPTETLEKVNQVIYENIHKMGENKYMTITLMVHDGGGRFFYSGLHQDIMIFRSATKKVELVETRGMWIGIMNNIEGMIGSDELWLNPGDALLLFTDGIVEAVDERDQMFSTERLADIFQNFGSRPVNEIRDGLLQALTPYTCKDDVTMLILKRLPVD